MNDPDRLELERWILGDLEEERAGELARRAAQDADLRARRAALEAELATLVVPALVPPWEQEAVSRGFPKWRSLAGLVAVGAMLAATLLLVLRTPPPEAGVVFRGGPNVEAHVVRAGEARRIDALMTVTAGDRVQLSIEVDRAGYVGVFDLQDDGRVQAWWGPDVVRSGQTVQAAALLDDYAGSERVFVVQGPHPFDVDTVRAGLGTAFDRSLAELDELPGLPGTQQRSFLLVRE